MLVSLVREVGANADRMGLCPSCFPARFAVRYATQKPSQKRAFFSAIHIAGPPTMGMARDNSFPG
jgi:hypothetical protein